MKRLVLLAFLFCSVEIGAVENDPFSEIQKSHIEGNVPDNAQFEAFLKRDITAYFREKGKQEIEITCSLLRKGATQSGVSLPKYYVWVEIKENNALIEEGAMRIAAIEKNRFEVLHYVSKDEIRKNEKLVSEIFPQLLVDEIIKRSKK